MNPYGTWLKGIRCSYFAPSRSVLVSGADRTAQLLLQDLTLLRLMFAQGRERYPDAESIVVCSPELEDILTSPNLVLHAIGLGAEPTVTME